MKVNIFESWKNRTGRTIPAGVYDINEEMAKKLIDEGKAEPTEKEVKRYYPDMETRESVEQKQSEYKTKKIKSKK